MLTAQHLPLQLKKNGGIERAMEGLETGALDQCALEALERVSSSGRLQYDAPRPQEGYLPDVQFLACPYSPLHVILKNKHASSRFW